MENNLMIKQNGINPSRMKNIEMLCSMTTAIEYVNYFSLNIYRHSRAE